MRIIEYTKQRLQAFLDEIDRLKESEFAYQDPREALILLEQIIKKDLKELSEPSFAGDDVVKEYCSHILSKLFKIAPLLGFILRATNVRNAFEIVGPLQRLASALLPPPGGGSRRNRTKLILSSEWAYSPFTYKRETIAKELPQFVLIGFPAPESSNPLLLPLAAHEIGHSAWSLNRLDTKYRDRLNQVIPDLIRRRHWNEYMEIFKEIRRDKALFTEDLNAPETWMLALDWGVRQCEESFCDFAGLRVFGLSYMKAFSYLLSPNPRGARPLHYPNLINRIKNLIHAAGRYSITLDTDYLCYFDDLQLPHLTKADQFRVQLADEACASVIHELMEDANVIADVAGIPSPESFAEEEKRIIDHFRKVVPAEGTPGLVPIVNAGWKAFEAQDLWSKSPHMLPRRNEILKNLIIKNLEVYEFECITNKRRKKIDNAEPST